MLGGIFLKLQTSCSSFTKMGLELFAIIVYDVVKLNYLGQDCTGQMCWRREKCMIYRIPLQILPVRMSKLEVDVDLPPVCWSEGGLVRGMCTCPSYGPLGFCSHKAREDIWDLGVSWGWNGSVLLKQQKPSTDEVHRQQQYSCLIELCFCSC